MRTNRLSRWLIGGALATAGVVTAFGGPLAGSGMGAQVLSDSAPEDVTVTEPVDDEAQGSVSTNGFDWS